MLLLGCKLQGFTAAHLKTFYQTFSDGAPFLCAQLSMLKLSITYVLMDAAQARASTLPRQCNATTTLNAGTRERINAHSAYFDLTERCAVTAADHRLADQFFNIYDFNFLFLNATIGWDGAKIGLFTSCWSDTAFALRFHCLRY